MIRLSLCMIVKNEEAVLTRVLTSAIQFADEILVADTGSTDRTVEIARQYTKHIYHYPWNDDFAAARNFICEKVSTEYWMWLDADDIVPAESITAILKLKETLSKSPQPDVVMMKYVAGFQPDGTSAFTYNRERILRTDRHFRWKRRSAQPRPERPPPTIAIFFPFDGRLYAFGAFRFAYSTVARSKSPIAIPPSSFARRHAFSHGWLHSFDTISGNPTVF